MSKNLYMYVVIINEYFYIIVVFLFFVGFLKRSCFKDCCERIYNFLRLNDLRCFVNSDYV